MNPPLRRTSELQTQTATEIAHANKCGQRVTMMSAMKCSDRAQAVMQLHRRVTQLTSFELRACDSTWFAHLSKSIARPVAFLLCYAVCYVLTVVSALLLHRVSTVVVC